MGKGRGWRRLSIGLALTLLLCGSALAWEQAPELRPGGSLIGIRVESEGAVVAALGGESGRQPGREAGVLAGDVITAVNGRPVHCAADLQEALKNWDGGPITLTVQREGESLELRVEPETNEEGAPELGLWLRDGLAGLGTLSFYEPETGLFGALGHAVNDVDSGVLLPLREGTVAPAAATGAVPGLAGQPGELLGSFDLNEKAGSIVRNTDCGVFGLLQADSPLTAGETLPAAARSELRVGPALLRCAADGETRDYAVQIERLFPEREDGRDFLLRVTDPALLALTGGIVQGMSGSPVLQDGRLVGAVTHVLVSDPARGYGISIETMLNAAGENNEE